MNSKKSRRVDRELPTDYDGTIYARLEHCIELIREWEQVDVDKACELFARVRGYEAWKDYCKPLFNWDDMRVLDQLEGPHGFAIWKALRAGK